MTRPVEAFLIDWAVSCVAVFAASAGVALLAYVSDGRLWQVAVFVIAALACLR